MNQETNEKLGQLIADLDGAIVQSIQNPLTLGESLVLARIDTACLSLLELTQVQNGWGHKVASGHRAETAAYGNEESAACERLLWQLRSRAGRLQLLLDSASGFYSRCFSAGETSELQACCFESGLAAYGVHAEWSSAGAPNHLIVDC